MAITKAKKQAILEETTQALGNSQSAVFVNFHKLPVEAVDALRSTLHEQGIGYRVIKKTLLRRALDAQNYEGELPALDGEIALAYADDLIAPAREVYEFAKGHKDSLAILGGVFEGRFQNQEEMTEIATIPPVQTLRGMFVNVINSPIQGFVSVLDQIAETKA